MHHLNNITLNTPLSETPGAPVPNSCTSRENHFLEFHLHHSFAFLVVLLPMAMSPNNILIKDLFLL